jgi:3-oxoacyl-[acyl-carrier-protein] synthase II
MVEMRMAIEGVGVTGAFGRGIDALATAIAAEIRPPVSWSDVITKDGTRRLPVYRAATEGLEEFFAKRELRRIDHYSKMALLAASLALKDAGVSAEKHGTTGIIVATGYGPHRTTFGFLDSFVKEGNAFASPTLFASSVHNAAAAYAAILLHARGPSLTVSQFEMSVPSALLTAWCWLREERVERVLFGAVDEYSDVLGYCWEKYFGALGTAGTAMDPFDFERQSAIPGEGSVFLVLTKNENQGRYGWISGVDMGFVDQGKLELPEGGLLILGVDGHKETGTLYSRHIPTSGGLVCYTPFYGSFPTSPAFDLAAAGLLIQGGLAAPRIDDPPVSDPPTGVPDRLSPRSITCLKIDREGTLGLVTVEGAIS